MDCDITRSVDRGCKNTMGGLIIYYAFPFVKHPKSLIVRSGLNLLSYPATNVYSFAVANGDYTDASDRDDGGEFVNQSLNASMINLRNDNQFRQLVSKDHGIIFRDRNNRFRLLGVYNGVEAEYQALTGSDYGDFNGYNVSFSAKEIDQALFFDDLGTVGFVPIDPIDLDNYIFQDGNNYIFN